MHDHDSIRKLGERFKIDLTLYCKVHFHWCSDKYTRDGPRPAQTVLSTAIRKLNIQFSISSANSDQHLAVTMEMSGTTSRAPEKALTSFNLIIEVSFSGSHLSIILIAQHPQQQKRPPCRLTKGWPL